MFSHSYHLKLHLWVIEPLLYHRGSRKLKCSCTEVLVRPVASLRTHLATVPSLDDCRIPTALVSHSTKANGNIQTRCIDCYCTKVPGLMLKKPDSLQTVAENEEGWNSPLAVGRSDYVGADVEFGRTLSVMSKQIPEREPNCENRSSHGRPFGMSCPLKSLGADQGLTLVVGPSSIQWKLRVEVLFPFRLLHTVFPHDSRSRSWKAFCIVTPETDLGRENQRVCKARRWRLCMPFQLALLKPKHRY